MASITDYRRSLVSSHTSLAVMGALAVLTLPTLGRQPLSWDEAVSASSAQRSLPHLAGMLSHTDAPLGFYYLLLHGWTVVGASLGISADNAWWLRLPSAVAAIIAAGLLPRLASRFLGRRVGLIAGLLLAVHPMVTYYAQDARPYTLVLMMFLVSTAGLFKALDDPRPRTIWTYAIAVVITLYLHLFACFALPAHLFLIWRRARQPRPWVIAGLGTATACAPLAWIAHGQSAELGWIPRPSVGVVWSVLTHLAGGTGFVIAVGAAIAVLLTARARVRWTEARCFLLIWALAPPIALVVIDFVSPELVARYALVAVPAEVTLLAILATRARAKAVVSFVALAGAFALVASLVQLTKPYKYEDYRAAADVIGDDATAGDAVLFLPISSREGFDIYAHLEPDLHRVADFAVLNEPAATDRIGGIDRGATQIASSLRDAPHIFVLGDTLSVADRTLRDPVSVAEEGVVSHFRIVATRHWGDLTLTILPKRSTTLLNGRTSLARPQVQQSIRRGSSPMLGS